MLLMLDLVFLVVRINAMLKLFYHNKAIPSKESYDADTIVGPLDK